MMSRAPAKASRTSPMMTSSSDPVFSLRYRAMNGMVAPSPRSLLGEGATIPFIARYRKEKTGSLDEVIIGEIRDALERLATLDARRQIILESLEEQKVLTAELRKSVEVASTLAELEDIYLPYRPI